MGRDDFTSPGKSSMTRYIYRREFLNLPDLQEFCGRLDRNPVWKRRLMLNAPKPKPYPNFIYKYRAFDLGDANHGNQISQLRDYLVESRLWLSSPMAFNDPFDMRVRIVFEGSPQEKRKHIIKKLEKYKPSLTRKQRECEASELLANGDVAFNLQNSQEGIRNNCGVCSFAGDPRDLLMWSHYGSKHAGVCMQFEIAQDAAVFASAHAVKYSKTYPVANYLEDGLEKLAEYMLLQKSEHWEYERERRIVQPNGADAYLEFRPAALSALILGCEISPKAEDEVNKVLSERKQKGHPAVKIFRACKHDTEYRLYLKRVTGLRGGAV